MSTSRRQPGRSREQVLERAARLFAEKGYDAASMRDIAEEPAIRPSSLYHHFTGKDRILFEICYGFQSDFNLEVLPELVADRPPAEAIRSAVRAHILFANRRWAEVVVGLRERRSLPSELRAPIQAPRRQYRDAIAATIALGCQEGIFDVPDAKLAAMAVLDLVNGLAHWFRPKSRRDLEGMAMRYGDAAVALISGWGHAED
jgi:AcrR family transcriptional regulator